ncbi:hypothetical protein BH23ACT2_BH23ACT2_18910 [soil metagenome]
MMAGLDTRTFAVPDGTSPDEAAVAHFGEQGWVLTRTLDDDGVAQLREWADRALRISWWPGRSPGRGPAQGSERSSNAAQWRPRRQGLSVSGRSTRPWRSAWVAASARPRTPSLR